MCIGTSGTISPLPNEEKLHLFYTNIYYLALLPSLTMHLINGEYTEHNTLKISAQNSANNYVSGFRLIDLPYYIMIIYTFLNC